MKAVRELVAGVVRATPGIAPFLPSSAGTTPCYTTPNIPTKMIPTKIACLKLSGKLAMDMRIPPLIIKIMLESNPLKSRIFVRRLAVQTVTRRCMTCCAVL